MPNYSGQHGKTSAGTERIFIHPEALRRLTGISRAQFETALARFEYALENVRECETVSGKPRSRAPGAGLKGILITPRDQLVFILTYYHLYPTQSAIASFFELTQQWASMWIKFLTPIANEALDRELRLPDRMALRIDDWITSEPLVLLLTDARRCTVKSFYPERKKPGPKPRRVRFEDYGL